jgi:tetratricopeptide (TPR) repeat protein
MLHRVWLAAVGLVVLALVWRSAPHVVAAYAYGRGATALDAGAYASAQDWLQRAVKLETNNPHIYRDLTQAYVAQGALDEALAAAQQAVTLDPANSLAHLALGDVYDARGESAQALAEYEAWDGAGLGRAEQMTVNYLALADRLWQARDQEAAVAIWRDKVLGLGYGDLYANWRLSQYYAEDEETAAAYREAARYFPLESIALSDAPELVDYQVRAIAELIAYDVWGKDLLTRVVSYLVWQHSDGEGAQQVRILLQRLVDRWPDNAELNFYLAEFFHRRGESEMAENLYKKTLELDAGCSQCMLRLGMVAEARAGSPGTDQRSELREAYGWYESYHQLAPDDVVGLARLAGVADKIGYPQAKELHQRYDEVTDDRLIVARLLGAQAEDVDLGPNLVEDGAFSVWNDRGPVGWVWSNMATGQPWNEGAFAGGRDVLTGFEEGGVRVDGIWLRQDETKEPGRAGWWRPVSLTFVEPDQLYLISLSYRTDGVPDGKATIWSTSQPYVWWRGDKNLPETDGAWHRFLAVGCLDVDQDFSIEPIIRLFSTGTLQFDDLRVRTVSIGGLDCDSNIETDARFWYGN